MRYIAAVVFTLFCFQLFAQQSSVLKLTNIDKPEKMAEFRTGDRIIVYFGDTSEVCGNIKSIDKLNLVVDSVTIPISKVQIIVDRKPKSAMFKLAGAGMVLGGAALTVGGFACLAAGLLPPSVESLYYVPGGLVLDYFGIHFIIQGINKLGGKGKQYDIGYRYTIEVFE
ncbi:MAG: hypothetical protein A2W93_13635 [Bacteroidetes bacterium GWF2_43_63]|nr:MAG: hypothetical protein A2W94_03830 [Bacteroidetes bacterium GWE2_42_42]OFY55030.1 MAG: hypothetical protein A2W93_13635 [Bacteroidetes bacterium GWF2_43_63]HBG69567.1 hypothetical protein [Bacteroidales bacterium]HCB60694.1 hypothetical protein [Bacteroidales bacterium]HCY24002.1 hypothetical protein [Bacteroidales bacterium]